jgi:16S rRNA (guanine527-N7)-methyltransferase
LSAPAVARLSTYLETLGRWNTRVNLTGARSPEERVRLLVRPVLPALPFVEPGTLLDVGSGNGSPGLVLALLREDLQVTLLEPRVRRWAFLREAARAAGVTQVTAVRARHDEYIAPPSRTVTLRALALPLTELTPHVADRGRLLVFGTPQGPAGPFVERAGAPGVHVFDWRDVSRET